MASTNTPDQPETGQGRLSILYLLLVLLLTYQVIQITYNIYFHPLSKVPGPIFWSFSNIPLLRSLLRGTYVQDVQKLHYQYGGVLRVAADEVSFATPEAWSEVFLATRERRELLKFGKWWAPPPGQTFNVVTAVDPEQHARFRKILAPAFSARALKAQEPFIQRYVNLLVDRLREASQNDPNKEIDMKKWFNYTTFDIFGDLGFGESFNCLENSRYHPWISKLLGSVRAALYFIATRYYPAVYYLLLLCIPPSIKKMADDHLNQIKEKVRRRMNYEVERPDIFSPLMATAGKNGKANDKEITLTQDEIDSLFSGLVTAGSETTATALTGTMNYLVQDPRPLTILTTEIRNRFEADSEITLDALRDLPYLNQVLNEGLRLCTPIPWVLPRVSPPEGATVCGVFLPGGTAVSVQPYTMNRNPEYWKYPNQFCPERWEPEVVTQSSSPFHGDRRDVFNPFLMGPRGCLGQHLAWSELRLIMAKLVWNFDFEQAKDPGRRLKWEDLRTFLLVETKPVWVTIKDKERQPAAGTDNTSEN